MPRVRAIVDIQCLDLFRVPGTPSADFEIEDEAFAAELAARGLIVYRDEALAEEAKEEPEAEDETETEDEPMVDSAGTEFDEARHMRYVNGDRAGQPIINKDGTWRNKPGTGTV